MKENSSAESWCFSPNFHLGGIYGIHVPCTYVPTPPPLTIMQYVYIPVHFVCLHTKLKLNGYLGLR